MIINILAICTYVSVRTSNNALRAKKGTFWEN